MPLAFIGPATIGGVFFIPDSKLKQETPGRQEGIRQRLQIEFSK